MVGDTKNTRRPFGLTPKQLQFCREYLIDHNGTQAAIRAGYSKKTAEMQASRLLSNAKARDFLASQEKKVSAKVDLTVERVLLGLIDIAENGRVEVARVKAFELLGKHLALFADRIKHEYDDTRLAELATESGVPIEKLLERAHQVLAKSQKKG